MGSIAIIGSGFSGLSVMYWLHQLGLKPVLISKEVPEKASSVPIGLMSPAGGQKGIPIWRFQEGIDSTRVLLQDFQKVFPNQILIKQTGVLRPAMQPIIEDFFKKNLKGFSSKDAQWLTSKEIQKINPFVFNEFGGIWIPSGSILAGDSICKAGLLFSESQSIPVIDEYVQSITPISRGYRIQTETHSLEFEKVIIASGSVFPKMEFISFSNLVIPVKGQLMTLKRITVDPAFSHGVSGQGYFGELGDLAAFGSTYEHEFSTVNATQLAENKLHAQLSTLFPDWKTYYKVQNQYTGVRVSTPDRMPLLGQFEERKNLFFYFGNGSKGMIWSSLLGKMLAELIINQTPLPKEVDIRRFKKRVQFI